MSTCTPGGPKGLRLALAIFVSSLLLLASHPAAAQYARAYANAPTNSNVLEGSVSSTHSENYSTDDQASDLKTRSNNWSVIYSRTLPGFTGNAAGLGFIVPYTSILGYTTGNQVTQDQDAMGDPSLTADYNLFGAKAMTREEFARTQATSYAGVHAVLTLPLGSYDENSTHNIGANRYSFKLTYQQSLAFNEAKTWLDFYGWARVFGDNTEFNGNNILSQDPLYGLEAHFSQNLSPVVFVSAGLIYNTGGATDVNDVEQAASRNTLKGVVGFQTHAWKGASILGTYTDTLARQNGDPKVQTWMLLVMQVF